MIPLLATWFHTNRNPDGINHRHNHDKSFDALRMYQNSDQKLENSSALMKDTRNNMNLRDYTVIIYELTKKKILRDIITKYPTGMSKFPR